MNEHLILEALGNLRDDIKDLKSDVTKVTDDHEKRIRKSEEAITQFKTVRTLLSGIAGLFGADALSHHWPSIFKP